MANNRAHARRRTTRRSNETVRPVSQLAAVLAAANCTWCDRELSEALAHLPEATAVVRTAPYVIARVNHPLPSREVVRQVEEGDREFAPPQHLFILLRDLLKRKLDELVLFWRSTQDGSLWEVKVTNRVVSLGLARNRRVLAGAHTLFMPATA